MGQNANGFRHDGDLVIDVKACGGLSGRSARNQERVRPFVPSRGFLASDRTMPHISAFRGFFPCRRFSSTSSVRTSSVASPSRQKCPPTDMSVSCQLHFAWTSMYASAAGR